MSDPAILLWVKQLEEQGYGWLTGAAVKRYSNGSICGKKKEIRTEQARQHLQRMLHAGCRRVNAEDWKYTPLEGNP